MDTSIELTANDIADFFLCFTHEHGDYITNLKLQKLIYYAQAWHLATFKEPIFTEDFQAWVHGPVILSVYHKYKRFSWNPITDDPEKNYQFNSDKKPFELEHNLESFLIDVFNAFGNESAYELEKMTHNEQPWINARVGLPMDEPCNEHITKQDMENYYSSL